MRVVLVLLVVVACAEAPLRAQDPPLCRDVIGGAWDPRFVAPGVSGAYAAANALIAIPGERFVVGGRFTEIAGQPRENVALWDRTHWRELGALPGGVIDLAIDDAQGLWAVGWRDDDAQYVARWLGDHWTMMAEDIEGIHGITAIPGGVAVWGRFSSFGMVSARGLVVWDGMAWSPGGVEAGNVWALARTEEGYCATGFLEVTGVPRHLGVVCWDGAAYRTVGDRADLSRLIRGPDGRWWGFSSSIEDGAQLSGLVVLEASGTWRLVAPLYLDSFLSSPTLASIHFDGDDLVIAGVFSGVGEPRINATGLARWTSQSGWTPVAPIAGEIRAMVGVGARLHLAGGFVAVGDSAAGGLAMIETDGSASAWVGTGITLAPYGSIGAVDETADGIVVAGSLIADSAVGARAIVLEDTGWRPLPGASTSVELRTAVLADGSYVISGEFLERWDGERWRRLVADRTLGAPVVADADGALYFVYRPEDGTTSEQLWRWRDGELAALGDAPPGIRQLLIFEGELVAVAHGDDDLRLLVRRDAGWRELRASSDGHHATVVPGIGLVVATFGEGVVAWDGTTWRALDERFAYTLAGCADGLVAAFAGPASATGVTSALAFLDRERWQTLAVTPGAVNVLSPTREGLFVASGAGQSPALRLLRYRSSQ